jgi:hypothetical protein
MRNESDDEKRNRALGRKVERVHFSPILMRVKSGASALRFLDRFE